MMASYPDRYGDEMIVSTGVHDVLFAIAERGKVKKIAQLSRETVRHLADELNEYLRSDGDD